MEKHFLISRVNHFFIQMSTSGLTDGVFLHCPTLAVQGHDFPLFSKPEVALLKCSGGHIAPSLPGLLFSLLSLVSENAAAQSMGNSQGFHGFKTRCRSKYPYSTFIFTIFLYSRYQMLPCCCILKGHCLIEKNFVYRVSIGRWKDIFESPQI